MNDQRVSLPDTLDNAPLSRIQFLVAALCGLTYGVDGFDGAVVGALAPNIAKEFLLSRLELGELLSATITGMVIGYLFIAPLSSRVGQKKLMVVATASFGVLSMSMLFAQGLDALIGLRFATGVALGAVLPSTIALTAEYSPRRWRASFITYMGLGMSFGLTAASLATAALLPWHGWRGVIFISGVLPIALSVLLAAFLPESMFYLARRGKGDDVRKLLAKAVPSLELDTSSRLIFETDKQASGAISELFADKRLFGTLAIWVAFFTNLMVNYFIQSWLPSILIDIGMSQRAALAMNAITMSASILSSVTTGPLMDRFGTYRVLCIMFFAGAVFIAVAGALVPVTATLVVCASFAAFYFNTAAQKGTGAICAFFYSPNLRATGFGWGSGIGRIGAVIGPIAIGQMMALHWQTQTLFYLASVPMMIGAIAILTLQTRLQDKPSKHPTIAAPGRTLGN